MQNAILNENTCIISSLNLYEFSQINNNEMALIFKKHSQQDIMMSPSFDLYCQTSTQNFYGHISNDANTPTYFRAIIPNSTFDLA